MSDHCILPLEKCQGIDNNELLYKYVEAKDALNEVGLDIISGG